MSKKILKIKFEYGSEHISYQWKGFEFKKQSVIDFLNAFVDLLPFDLEVKERASIDFTHLNEQRTTNNQ
ncbi:hypothetical protein SAMN05192545_2872 [Maribacter dokdonensis]|uniref:Uncharacterized protein n=1 Tax=Maribacter dokdonensis TaxID=320912 RepID=A0ABY0UTA3_9FLAO|nr:hypothetical protein [Maribacter dokdonensis]SDT14685.1 hypothetical protein SAMN05192545_2872 [Maribacter dokdonensis]